jgi:hypothetical protein
LSNGAASQSAASRLVLLLLPKSCAVCGSA